jgi:hypothetical protein
LVELMIINFRFKSLDIEVMIEQHEPHLMLEEPSWS